MRKANFWEAFLSNPTAIAIAVVALLVIGAVWYYTQVQEAKESDKFRESQRDSDSIWNK